MPDFQSFNAGWTRSTPVPVAFHLHDWYEIYLFIGGDVEYFVEKDKYRLRYGDILVFNSMEVHKPTFFSDAPYERSCIHFAPEALRRYGCADMDLLSCFEQRPHGSGNLIRMQGKQQEEFVAAVRQLCDAERNKAVGADTERLALMLRVMVLLNRAFVKQNRAERKVHKGGAVYRVLDYIDANLDQQFDLDDIASACFLSKGYLCRAFKQYTGSTIHRYILNKRVSRAKQLLLDGHNVTETCAMSGFNDYSNFIRSFSGVTGVSPGVYQKSNLNG